MRVNIPRILLLRGVRPLDAGDLACSFVQKSGKESRNKHQAVLFRAVKKIVILIGMGENPHLVGVLNIEHLFSSGGAMVETDELVKLSFFLEIGKAISKTKTIDQTLQCIMKYIGDIFAPYNFSIMLRNAETGVLTFTEVVGECSDKLKGLQLPRGEGIAGWIAETRQPVIVADVRKDSRFSSRVDHYSGSRPVPSSACPCFPTAGCSG